MVIIDSYHIDFNHYVTLTIARLSVEFNRKEEEK